MINKNELENFINGIKKDNNISKKEKVFCDIQIEEILFLKDKKISQKNIIDFLFDKYPEIKEIYSERTQTLKSLISKIKKEPTTTRRRKRHEESLKLNSSKNEESIKNDSEIISSNIKKSNKDDVEDTGADLSKKSSIQNFFK